MRNAKAGLLLIALILMGAAAHAAQPAEPDPTGNKALAALVKSGAKFFYLGRNANLDGWVAIKDGQIQVIYKPANNTYVLVGYLFGPNGENLTAEQVKTLAAKNKEFATLANPQTPAASPAAQTNVEPAASAPPSAAPNAAASLDETPDDLHLPPGERLMKLLTRAPGVTLGTKAEAPILDVLILPSAPACLAFWKNIRDDVQSGVLRVRLFPAGLSKSDDERLAARLLSAQDPLSAWDKFAQGDKAALAGQPDQASLDKARINTGIIEKWRLPAAPYLLYRGKTGTVKVVQGPPNDVKLLAADMGSPAGEGAKP